MTLQEFKQSILKDIERFENEWTAGQEDQPAHYPDEMEEGEWFEQFLAHQTNNS